MLPFVCVCVWMCKVGCCYMKREGGSRKGSKTGASKGEPNFDVFISEKNVRFSDSALHCPGEGWEKKNPSKLSKKKNLALFTFGCGNDVHSLFPLPSLLLHHNTNKKQCVAMLLIQKKSHPIIYANTLFPFSPKYIINKIISTTTKSYIRTKLLFSAAPHPSHYR